MSKLTHCAIAAAILLSLAACASSVKPETIISQVSPGMTQQDVVRRIGPPDSEYGASGNSCFQYALGDNSGTHFAVFFDDQQRVTAAMRGSCPGLPR
ncbi:outer membrane protein assembly factor BamE domain-containing protein [Paraburkholderia ferrariae]|uniref:outer membrane protein assembly factor BamE domain-containing protein n=1 Tax=Paraburkholderia ferrariae TaxID=386056 RepID=UPI000485269C|nr:outer membrane protein assembly factor BamE [Paraburkholderia ferrariae]